MPFLRQFRIQGLLVILLAAVLFAVFCSLGTWQLQRRAWKLDLIALVETQLARPPIPAPGRSKWDSISGDDAYLPLTISGTYLHDSETLVQAMTALGSGYWVMTPLRTSNGTIVLVNRGFVDQAHKSPQVRSEGQQAGQLRVTGLLRLSEPDGRIFRPNNMAENRWYSRDVPAIGNARGLPADDLAPYFLDADATPIPGGWPVGGLTVVNFRNSHLIYAITWYALAMLVLVGAWIVLRRQDVST